MARYAAKASHIRYGILMFAASFLTLEKESIINTTSTKRTTATTAAAPSSLNLKNIMLHEKLTASWIK